MASRLQTPNFGVRAAKLDFEAAHRSSVSRPVEPESLGGDCRALCRWLPSLSALSVVGIPTR